MGHFPWQTVSHKQRAIFFLLGKDHSISTGEGFLMVSCGMIETIRMVTEWSLQVYSVKTYTAGNFPLVLGEWAFQWEKQT